VFFRCGLGLAECSVGAYKGWVSVVWDVPGFIRSGDGAGRGGERTQSTQTANKDVDGGKPARFPPKIAELSENFAEQFRVSIITRGDTLLHLMTTTYGEPSTTGGGCRLKFAKGYRPLSRC
jgi:hypothetical protein